MAEWSLRDEIAEIIDNAGRQSSREIADQIMDLLERCAANEPGDTKVG